MKKLLFIFLFSTLSACVAPVKNVFDKCHSGVVQVRVELRSPAEVAKSWGSLTGKTDDRFPTLPVAGGYVGKDKNGMVVMVLPKLTDDEQLKSSIGIWGHELAHVVCGDWHP